MACQELDLPCFEGFVDGGETVGGRASRGAGRTFARREGQRCQRRNNLAWRSVVIDFARPGGLLNTSSSHSEALMLLSGLWWSIPGFKLVSLFLASVASVSSLLGAMRGNENTRRATGAGQFPLLITAFVGFAYIGMNVWWYGYRASLTTPLTAWVVYIQLKTAWRDPCGDARTNGIPEGQETPVAAGRCSLHCNKHLCVMFRKTAPGTYSPIRR
jgi:hypothetical protein